MDVAVIVVALLLFAAFMAGYSLAYRFYCVRCGGRDTYRVGTWIIRCHACERVQA